MSRPSAGARARHVSQRSERYRRRPRERQGRALERIAPSSTSSRYSGTLRSGRIRSDAQPRSRQFHRSSLQEGHRSSARRLEVRASQTRRGRDAPRDSLPDVPRPHPARARSRSLLPRRALALPHLHERPPRRLPHAVEPLHRELGHARDSPIDDAPLAHDALAHERRERADGRRAHPRADVAALVGRVVGQAEEEGVEGRREEGGVGCGTGSVHGGVSA